MKKCALSSIALLTLALLLASCASLSKTGVGRIKHYTIESEQLPDSFDGITIAFISDIHYPSLFTQKRLKKVVNELRSERPALLLLGGDYVTGDEYIAELFDSLSRVHPSHGIYAVMGNHERHRSDAIAEAMRARGIHLLCDETVPIIISNDTIFVSGVLNSFAVGDSTKSPTASIPNEKFSILVAHTPDYAERVNANADLILSGHTHGGQVSIFGIYTPVKNTVYGTRFLRGLNHTSNGTPIITTTGIGTSRRRIRFWVPSEIVYVTLKKR